MHRPQQRHERHIAAPPPLPPSPGGGAAVSGEKAHHHPPHEVLARGKTPSRRRRRRRRTARAQKAQSEEDANLKVVAEETLLALRMMCTSGLRHPLHGHSYTRYTALRPRVCYSCELPIFGPFSKACHCLACGLVVHRQCVMRITKSPCGNYRGLRNPRGLLSSSSQPSSSPAAETKISPPTADKKEGGDQEEEVMWRRGQEEPQQPVLSGNGDNTVDDTSSFTDADSTTIASSSTTTTGGTASSSQQQEQQQGEGENTATSSSSSTAITNSSTARRMTFEALAVVGSLVGSMVGAPTGALTAFKFGASSSSFTFSKLKGAGALAGAYTGYKRSATASPGTNDVQEEEDLSASPPPGRSMAAMYYHHQQQQQQLHSGSGNYSSLPTMPSPVAMGWSRWAQKVMRDVVMVGEGEREGGDAADATILLDFIAFARKLEREEKGEEEGDSRRRVGQENSSGIMAVASPSVSSPSSSPPSLIEQILRSKETAPGYLWGLCLGQFQKRHVIIRDHTSRQEEQHEKGEGGNDDSSTIPPGSGCQDAAAIIHEVALVLVDYVPGLLTSMEAYDEAFQAVEAVCMRTLYPVLLAECRLQTAALNTAVEDWYRVEQAEENEGTAAGNNSAALEKAARELHAMATEVRGLKKVRRVLKTCLALGEGDLDMTADELLPALGRVVRLAAVPALPAHLAFIEETCDTGALLGAEGYALTSLQVVVSLIIQPPAEDEVEDREAVEAGEEEEEEEEEEKEETGEEQNEKEGEEER